MFHHDEQPAREGPTPAELSRHLDAYIKERAEEVCQEAGRIGHPAPRSAVVQGNGVVVLVAVLREEIDLSRRQQQILQALGQSEYRLTLDKILAALPGKPVSERTLRRELQDLQAMGLVDYIGKGRHRGFGLTARMLGEPRPRHMFGEDATAPPEKARRGRKQQATAAEQGERWLPFEGDYTGH